MLRTRPPRSTPERVRARLACIRHAASVDPEPGSNSPPLAHKGHAPEPDPRRDPSLRVGGHASRSGLLLLLGEPNPNWARLGSPRRAQWSPLAPSSAHDAQAPVVIHDRLASRPLRQLVKVPLPFRKPAEPTPRAVPLSREPAGVSVTGLGDQDATTTLPGHPGDAVVPRLSTSGTPLSYHSASTMSSGAGGAIGSPRVAPRLGSSRAREKFYRATTPLSRQRPHDSESFLAAPRVSLRRE